MATVSRPKYNGVDIDHPTLTEYTKNLLRGRDRKGDRRETRVPEHLREIMRVTGLPAERIREIEREEKR